jgi:hypothetical protein
MYQELIKLLGAGGGQGQSKELMGALGNNSGNQQYDQIQQHSSPMMQPQQAPPQEEGGVDIEKLLEAMMKGNSDGGSRASYSPTHNDVSGDNPMTSLQGIMSMATANQQPQQQGPQIGQGAPGVNEYLRSLMGG